MKDSWLNLGFLGDELKPYVEPNETIDDKRVGNYFDILKKILRFVHVSKNVFLVIYISFMYLQCFDTVGWTAGRASGL